MLWKVQQESVLQRRLGRGGSRFLEQHEQQLRVCNGLEGGFILSQVSPSSPLRLPGLHLPLSCSLTSTSTFRHRWWEFGDSHFCKGQ